MVSGFPNQNSHPSRRLGSSWGGGENLPVMRFTRLHGKLGKFNGIGARDHMRGSQRTGEASNATGLPEHSPMPSGPLSNNAPPMRGETDATARSPDRRRVNHRDVEVEEQQVGERDVEECERNSSYGTQEHGRQECRTPFGLEP